MMQCKKFIFLCLFLLLVSAVSTAVIYRKLKKIQTAIQITSVTNEESYFHLFNNRILNDRINREEFIAKVAEEGGLQLEVGPYYRPVLKGENVRYFDVLDKEGLIRKAKVDDVSIELIPEIDYVEPYGDMSIIKDKFDLVFSSHNIEHQVNLVKHLQQVEELLKTGGKFYLAAPDKRYCFDRFTNLTPLSMVLAVYWEPPIQHSLQTILSKCESAHNGAKKHWRDESSVPLLIEDNSCFVTEYENYKRANGGYIDAHKWRFTPESFAGIINELYRMNLISLKIEKIWNTAPNSHEFYVVLVKDLIGSAQNSGEVD